METAIIAVWLGVWFIVTVWVATWGLGDLHSPPPFFYPLIFGWVWPVIVVTALIVAPLAIIAERNTQAKSETPSDV